MKDLNGTYNEDCLEEMNLDDVPKIPIEYVDYSERKKTHLTKTTPRRWTQSEIDWCLSLRSKGYTHKDIGESVGRSEVSVSVKMKRLTKSDDSYNNPHLDEKYKSNKEFVDFIKPKTVADAYCGVKSYYRTNHPDIEVTTNDKDVSIEADYHMDAYRFMSKMNGEGKKFDIVDLDPFGSAFESFQLAITMARKGLVITLGEMGHKRWRRTDYVGRVYDIHSLEEFTSQRIIDEIIKIGRRLKVELEVYKVDDFKNISRVYFLVKEYKNGVIVNEK